MLLQWEKKSKGGGCIHKLVDSICCLSSYSHWNCLIMVTSKTVGLLSCSHHPLATSPQNQQEWVPLPFTLWIPFPLKNWELHVSWVYKSSPSGNWIPRAFPSWQIGLGCRRPCGSQGCLLDQCWGPCLGHRCQGTSQFCLSEFEEHLSNSSCGWNIKLWQNFLCRVAMYQYYPCSAH